MNLERVFVSGMAICFSQAYFRGAVSEGDIEDK